MTSDGGKGSAPRPIPNYEQFEKNWDQIFKPKVRVSGVPYEVYPGPEWPFKKEDVLFPDEPMSMDDLIATLEQENKYLRARIERLEDERPKWDGLTENEIGGLIELATFMDEIDITHLVQLTEDKLKEKNASRND